MAPRPRLLYSGPDADSVARRWSDEGDPFVADCLAPDEPPSALEDRARFDCVFCFATDDGDVRALLERVRELSGAVPIVLVWADDGDHRDILREFDVTHSLTASPDDDPAELLAELTPVVERAIDRRRELSMLESLMENIPMSVYFKDRKSRHVKVSDGMIDMIGPSYIENEEGKRHNAPADVEGKTDYDLYDESLAEEAITDDRAVMESEEPIRDRIERSYGEKGTGTYVATSKAPWYDDGRLVGILGITRDVSERKGYEYQLERQNERLEHFATMVSHDIRNPLSVAVGRLDPARKSGDEEHFDAIERSLDRIEHIIDDILRVTRQAESVLDPGPVSLAEVAEEAWESVDCDAATLEIRTDTEVLAARARLSELLENLFRNAIEHGLGDDGGELTVTVGEVEAGDGFYVADDGAGVPPDKRSTVFEAGISEASNIGIGLSLVNSIANAHNWRVGLSESESGGSRFEFHGVRKPPDGA